MVLNNLDVNIIIIINSEGEVEEEGYHEMTERCAWKQKQSMVLRRKIIYLFTSKICIDTKLKDKTILNTALWIRIV